MIIGHLGLDTELNRNGTPIRIRHSFRPQGLISFQATDTAQVPGIKLACDDLLDFVEHLDGHVASTGTNLQDHVCVSQGRLKLFYMM